MSPTPAIVVPARADWGPRGAALAEQVRSLLGPAALRVDHIGSTAIPGMAAKDVIDLQVSVGDLSDAERFGAALAALGFERRPYERDHVPAGRADDPARWSKRLWSRTGHPDGDSNLHVRLAGSPNERLALLFRDWFRAHPDAIPAYAAFKLDLAARVPGREVYADLKDPVVDLVVAVAEPWASATAWTP